MDTEQSQTATDEKWMRYALSLAQRAAELGEVPVGAVVVADDELLGEGWNQPIRQHDPTAHAEIMAIRAAGLAQQNYRISNATLYVTLEPCMMCAGAMVHARINRLVYAATEPKAGVVNSQDQAFTKPFLNHTITVDAGVLAAEASALLSAFFKRRRDQIKAKKNQIG